MNNLKKKEWEKNNNLKIENPLEIAAKIYPDIKKMNEGKHQNLLEKSKVDLIRKHQGSER